ncbi:hypothetical protein CRUP_019428, partial [Coryphaenoides rupestris]
FLSSDSDDPSLVRDRHAGSGTPSISVSSGSVLPGAGCLEETTSDDPDDPDQHTLSSASPGAEPTPDPTPDHLRALTVLAVNGSVWIPSISVSSGSVLPGAGCLEETTSDDPDDPDQHTLSSASPGAEPTPDPTPDHLRALTVLAVNGSVWIPRRGGDVMVIEVQAQADHLQGRVVAVLSPPGASSLGDLELFYRSYEELGRLEASVRKRR